MSLARVQARGTALAAQKRGRYAVVDKQARTVDGIVFDSGAEAKRYAELKLLERAGAIAGLELQPEFAIQINGKPFCKYAADFRYADAKTGRVVVEDVKSAPTAKDTAYRLRKKAAELFHNIVVEEVFA
ncbi:MAG: DUF1064 domain-containing protein [Hyphomicrobiales bacterium]|nr:DUF1064 domain-containing protein [Hyphomicrobiales bacterium]